jgi:hypothetical protein
MAYAILVIGIVGVIVLMARDARRGVEKPKRTLRASALVFVTGTLFIWLHLRSLLIATGVAAFAVILFVLRLGTLSDLYDAFNSEKPDEQGTNGSKHKRA